MRIGAIADIHGNLQALEAVLEDMKTFAPDILIVAGDMVGGGAQSREVLELLSTVDHIATRGTHEDLLLIVSKGEENDTNMFVEAARYETEVLGAYSDEIVHVFRPCRPLSERSDASINIILSSGRHGQGRIDLSA